MKYLVVLACVIVAAMAVDDQDLEESKLLLLKKLHHAPLRHRVPSRHPGRHGRSTEEETDDQQVDEWHRRPYYGRPHGGWGYARRWRRSTDDQEAQENHRRPYFGSHYRPSLNRYGRSAEDAEVQSDDQQGDDLHYRRYGGYGKHYGGYYRGHGYRKPIMGKQDFSRTGADNCIENG